MLSLAEDIAGLRPTEQLDLLKDMNQDIVWRYSVVATDKCEAGRDPVKSMAMCILATMQQLGEMMTPGNPEAIPSLEVAGWFELSAVLCPRDVPTVPIISAMGLGEGLRYVHHQLQQI